MHSSHIRDETLISSHLEKKIPGREGFSHANAFVHDDIYKMNIVGYVKNRLPGIPTFPMICQTSDCSNSSIKTVPACCFLTPLIAKGMNFLIVDTYRFQLDTSVGCIVLIFIFTSFVTANQFNLWRDTTMTLQNDYHCCTWVILWNYVTLLFVKIFWAFLTFFEMKKRFKGDLENGLIDFIRKTYFSFFISVK